MIETVDSLDIDTIVSYCSTLCNQLKVVPNMSQPSPECQLVLENGCYLMYVRAC